LGYANEHRKPGWGSKTRLALQTHKKEEQVVEKRAGI